MTVTVDAQWALYGRAADPAGFRVLSCSMERLNEDNFSEVIGRFSLGTPDALPQVTISWVPSDSPDDNYLALAIHKFADGDRDVRPSETGRLVAVTSYFCVPYRPLADAAIGYLPLYQALSPVRLPTEGGGRPRQITLAAAKGASVGPSADVPARLAASLLITGRPVCVLGAGSIDMIGRLQFIDTVMALLPYGLRARMAAATWVRPTHRDHRFRLYFSDARRDHDPPDHVVWWDRPELTALTAEHEGACEYQRFLEDEARRSDVPLSRLTEPRGFKRKELREMLADLGVTEREFPGEEAEPQEPPQLDPREPPQPEHATQLDLGARILAELADHAKALDLPILNADVGRLRQFISDVGLSDSQRASYREFIARQGLLSHNPLPEQQAAMLYDAILPLAFGQPLTYEGYCQLEDCLGDPPGTAPDKILLKAIERGGTTDALVAAIVLMHLGKGQKLHRLFTSSRFDVEQLISLLAGKWERPQHFRIACDVTLDYLTAARARYAPATVRRMLRPHGFLAHALLASGCPGQYQVHALYRLLRAAYPDELSRTAISAILRGNRRSPVTPALFAAVLLRLARPEDAQLARDAYATASLFGLAFEPETRDRIERLLPVLDETSGSNFLGTRMTERITGRDGPDDVPGPGT